MGPARSDGLVESLIKASSTPTLKAVLEALQQYRHPATFDTVIAIQAELNRREGKN